MAPADFFSLAQCLPTVTYLDAQQQPSVSALTSGIAHMGPRSFPVTSPQCVSYRHAAPTFSLTHESGQSS